MADQMVARVKEHWKGMEKMIPPLGRGSGSEGDRRCSPVFCSSAASYNTGQSISVDGGSVTRIDKRRVMDNRNNHQARGG